MLYQRIGIFTALPLRSLDQLTLQNKLKDIGRTVMPSLAQRGVAECLGTAFLLAAVVGSGIMAAKLSGGNGALALLCNTLPTGAILTVLILTLGPVSGAHFIPAVSVAMALRRELPASTATIYIGAQVIGAVVGVWAAHLMFELPLWQLSGTVRTGPGQWFAEAVATFGLLLTILGCSARTPSAVPFAVGLYITSAYWFTASTSFANPAVTIARSLSDTFAGIAPSGVAAFHSRAVRRDVRGARSWPVVLAHVRSTVGHLRCDDVDGMSVIALIATDLLRQGSGQKGPSRLMHRSSPHLIRSLGWRARGVYLER